MHSIEPMNVKYFIIECRSIHRPGYAIWFGNDTDGVVTVDSEFVLFRTVAAVTQFTHACHLVLEDVPPVVYRFDELETWLQNPRPELVQPHLFLDVWNLCTDIAASTDQVFEISSHETTHVYRKLFVANNLPSMTPVNQQYVPRWSTKELRILVSVFEAGTKLLYAARYADV
jgi:hypothetical protein